MLEVTKDQNDVVVTATLSPRKFTSEEKISIHWEDAYREAKNKFPETEISDKPDSYLIVSNAQRNSGTWKFKIIKKEEKIEDKSVENNKNKTKRRKRKTNNFAEIVKSAHNPLTPTEEPATVEETSQSDQPAIVQEPTE